MEYEAAFHAEGGSFSGTIAEPNKFWRHCREALAKWVLSQIARYEPVQSTRTRDDVSESSSLSSKYEHLAQVHFLPSRAVLGSRRTYDAQLVRDLTFKSILAVRNDAAFQKAVTEFVASFELGRRCARAASDIEDTIQALQAEGEGRLSSRSSTSATASSWHRPIVRSIPCDEKTTAVQKRIEGDVVEVAIQWAGARYTTDAAVSCGIPALSKTINNVRPVVVPRAVWERLMACYSAFGRRAEPASTFSADVSGCMSHDDAAVYRAAAVVLRYEHCLASGSLQLCADSSLKDALEHAGYFVMDLCASPINAYMRRGESTGAAPVVQPRRFCSAFFDTDRFFGSMGSALLYDAVSTTAYFDALDTPSPRAPSAPLLLTLDVPYDEDLCELLFLKLARECRAVANGSLQPAPVDYLLVLPLWWDVRFDNDLCPKRFFSTSATASHDDNAAMEALVLSNSSYLHQGLQIHYEWLTSLPQSMAVAAADQRDGIRYLSVFDGVFVRDSYTYFCTSTNKHLNGVTATEVIGISLRQCICDSSSAHHAVAPLQAILDQFYATTTPPAAVAE